MKNMFNASPNITTTPFKPNLRQLCGPAQSSNKTANKKSQQHKQIFSRSLYGIFRGSLKEISRNQKKKKKKEAKLHKSLTTR